MPSEMQSHVTNPERFLVGHPFNPVYLCPLVEIVGGKNTSEATKLSAKDFYESLGMHALMVKKEVPGHISDRLQEAMWREILHALNDDIASTQELDESIAYGPGLRWAIMGMNQIYMIAGGAGGARHFIEQFGPALEWPWTHLKAPELSNKIIDKFVDGTSDQAEGKSIRELEIIRDECLVEVQKVLAKHNIGAGKTTLTEMLSKHYGWEPHYEDVLKNPYLDDFYERMERWSFNLQIYFLNSRFNQMIECSQNKKDTIQDRTIYAVSYTHLTLPTIYSV